MRIVNLQPFWSVQECSGGRVHIFASVSEAQAAIDSWNEELDQQLVQWESGDHSVSDSLIESTLEPDLEGGCYFSYHIHPAWRPSGYDYHAPYSAQSYLWSDAVGHDSIQWGNPATARPSRSSKR